MGCHLQPWRNRNVQLCTDQEMCEGKKEHLRRFSRISLYIETTWVVFLAGIESIHLEARGLVGFNGSELVTTSYDIASLIS